ncbi:HNH endonuclease [Haloarcula hispanica]|uniref:homing endonuclease associated repeat-containing protein n=1 Tax=Haloarcula hispanica TaxID=51589 RepID=UPI001A92AE6E|nr:HNH endonuclease [Haloarcula hispanica]MCJ0620356.1 HNH endonuclease [Haloarcula hispanica]
MTSEADCIQALRDAASELGESPTKAQYEELGVTPASGTIQRVMDSWNGAKKAAGLETNHSRGSRLGTKPADVSLPDGSSWADLSQDQRWHYRNAARNQQRTLNRRAKHRAWVCEYKRDSDGCCRCGEADPACLDFHHRDDTEKEMTISKMITTASRSRSSALRWTSVTSSVLTAIEKNIMRSRLGFDRQQPDRWMAMSDIAV